MECIHCGSSDLFEEKRVAWRSKVAGETFLPAKYGCQDCSNNTYVVKGKKYMSEEHYHNENKVGGFANPKNEGGKKSCGRRCLYCDSKNVMFEYCGASSWKINDDTVVECDECKCVDCGKVTFFCEGGFRFVSIFHCKEYLNRVGEYDESKYVFDTEKDNLRAQVEELKKSLGNRDKSIDNLSKRCQEYRNDLVGLYGVIERLLLQSPTPQQHMSIVLDNCQLLGRCRDRNFDELAELISEFEGVS